MSTPAKAKQANLYDVEVNDGTSFVVEAADKKAAEDSASKQLAEAGKPAATFTVTLAESAAERTADKTASMADDLLSGLDASPAPAREAKPDPKPGKASSRKSKGATGTVPPEQGKASPAAKTAVAKARAARDSEPAASKKSRPKGGAKQANPTGKPTQQQTLITFKDEAAKIWNGIKQDDSTTTALHCRVRTLEALEKAHPEHAPHKDTGKGGLFRGRIPALLKEAGIDARKLPAHFSTK